MPYQKTAVNFEMNVQKRNGQVVAYNELRVKKAIGNAFKEQAGLPREVELSIEMARDVDRAAAGVFHVLKERLHDKASVTVEEIQDEVVRQLYENGFKDTAELYANYRKQHAARRALFELYTTTKRDGKVVSFKPEKITLAIAGAFRAYNNGILTETLLEKAREIAAQVVADIRAQWPEGKCLDIEEIQDLVEKNLMKAGYLDIARRYIAYREERARVRRDKQRAQDTREVSQEWIKAISYKTKDGRQELLPLDEIRFSIESCCEGLANVSVEEILNESRKNYFNGITREQLATAHIMAARSFLEKDPQYTFAAARLLLLALYQEALGHPVSFEGMKAEYATYFAQYIHKAVELDLLSPDLLQFDLKLLGHDLKPKRDLLFHYMGLQTLYDRYFLHWEKRRLELPQIFWMRVAMGLAKKEGAQKNEKAMEFYDVLSTFRFTSSTPTLFNSGTRHSQLSSCFLTTIEDDLSHIFKCVQDDAMLSK